MRDTVEVSKLDGSQRRVLFDTDLINPRPIVTNPAYGWVLTNKMKQISLRQCLHVTNACSTQTAAAAVIKSTRSSRFVQLVLSCWYRRLYWADWNRDGPKIEMSNMDGTDRTVLVKDDLGLPNGLTFDPDNQQLCWADAGETHLTGTWTSLINHCPPELILSRCVSQLCAPRSWSLIDRLMGLQVLVRWSVWILTAGWGGRSFKGSSIHSLSSPLEGTFTTLTGGGNTCSHTQKTSLSEYVWITKLVQCCHRKTWTI